MGQLHHAALFMSDADLHWTLAYNMAQTLMRQQDPYQFKPYETAEIQECSDTQAVAFERGDYAAAAAAAAAPAQWQWHG